MLYLHALRYQFLTHIFYLFYYFLVETCLLLNITESQQRFVDSLLMLIDLPLVHLGAGVER